MTPQGSPECNFQAVAFDAFGDIVLRLAPRQLEDDDSMGSPDRVESDRAREQPESLSTLMGGLRGRAVDSAVAHLQNACYVIIGYLSGARDSELTSVLRGGVARSTVSTGRCGATACTGGGTAPPGGRGPGCVGGDRTGRQGSGGPRATVRQLARRRRPHCSPARLPAERERARPHSSRCGVPRVLAGALRSPSTGLRDLAARSTRTTAVPDHEGAPWNFTPNQLRRTLACTS